MAEFPKNYVRLDDPRLADCDPQFLRGLNTHRAGTIEAADFQIVDQANILDEQEITGFLLKEPYLLPYPLSSHRLHSTLADEVPSIYYSVLTKSAEVKEEDVSQVYSHLLYYLVNIPEGHLTNLFRYDDSQSGTSIQLKELSAMPADFYVLFGTNSGLAYGLLSRVTNHGSLVSTVKTVNPRELRELLLWQLATKMDELKQSFIFRSVGDMLLEQSDSPEILTKVRSNEVTEFCWQLEQYIKVFSGMPNEPMMELLRNGIMEKALSLGTEYSKALQNFLTSFEQCVKSGCPTPEHARLHARLMVLNSILVTQGMILDLEFRGVHSERAAPGWNFDLMVGKIQKTKFYHSVVEGVIEPCHYVQGLLNSHKSMLHLVRQAQSSGQFPKEPNHPLGLQNWGRFHWAHTKKVGGHNEIVVDHVHIDVFLEDARDPAGWVGQKWANYTHDFRLLSNSPESEVQDSFRLLSESLDQEQLGDEIAIQATFHELEHSWRLRLGLDSPEESAMYASVAYSDKPRLALLVGLLKQTYPTLEFGPTEHSQAVLSMLVALAFEYGVAVPTDEKLRNKTDWVEDLFNAMDGYSQNDWVNETMLRRRILHAYHKRFGRPLEAVSQKTPVRVIEFE